MRPYAPIGAAALAALLVGALRADDDSAETSPWGADLAAAQAAARESGRPVFLVFR